MSQVYFVFVFVFVYICVCLTILLLWASFVRALYIFYLVAVFPHVALQASVLVRWRPLLVRWCHIACPASGCLVVCAWASVPPCPVPGGGGGGGGGGAGVAVRSVAGLGEILVWCGMFAALFGVCFGTHVIK